MHKNPFILLLLLLSSYSHAQKIALGIPPVYIVEVDTSEWSVLFSQPEAMMLYNGGMPQELVHKKTGFIISLKAGYLLDINGIQWLNKMIEKDPSVHTSNENPINRAFLKDPLASQRSLLFGNIKPLPEQSLPPFDAYQKSDATLNIASSFLWMVDTHFINLYTQQTPNETELQWLKEILASVRTTSIQEMDSMAHYPLLNPDTIALKSQRRHMLENSHSMLAKQLLLPENDHLLLSDLSFQFTFTSMHQSLVRFVEHEISMTELLPLHKKWNPENANPYVNYHIPLHKKEILWTQIYMEKILELFPRSIHKIEPIYPTTLDKVEYYEGYNDSVYYLLQMDLRKAQWTYHLDSMRFDHWINQEGKIERQKHESNRFSGPIRMKRLEGNTDDFCAHTTRTFRVKNEIHRSFDDHYFYRHSSQAGHLFPFRAPSKTAAYESFVLYEIDEPDQKIIDRFFASNDTLRYYTGADMRDESPDMVMYRGIKKMEYQSVPQKRLYGTSIFTTDLNHNQALEYWQFYVCNGIVIQTNFYSTLEADDSLKKQQKKVLKLPVLQKLISTSTSTGINNHQMLFHSKGSFENEFIQDIAVEAEDGALREDRSILMERDTSVYQYPTRQAIFMPMDPEGIQFMESRLGHTLFSQLPTHTHYKVSFIIEKDGSLSHLSVRCIGGRPVMAVEDKLFDIVRAMPNWQSATYDGYPVRSYGSLYFGLYLKNKK